MAVAEPLRRQVQVTQLTDAEIRRLTRNASAEARHIIRSLENKGTTSAAVRSVQIQLAKVNAEMWAGVGDAAKIGIGDAVYEALDLQAAFDSKVLGKAGFSEQYWRSSMLAQAQVGAESLISRKQNGYTLSDRVYRNRALSQGQVDKAIDNGLLLGKSAAEIAADVKRFIDPATPGGASYAAMRLGRTEVQNAFHATSVRNYQQTPWIEKVVWRLSGSHPRPDACNEYADHKPYKPENVPDKPHPNCLCYVEPVVMDIDKYAKNFQAGKYDSYIEEQLGCSRVA